MGLHQLSKGLDVPTTGRPRQDICPPNSPIRHVAVLADDFHGMKPRMLIQEGDLVQRGQPLFEDRKTPGVLHTAPGAGKVVAVNRGAKRALQSVVIALSESEQAGNPQDADFFPFASWRAGGVAAMGKEGTKALLLESGAWTALRTRPFSRVASPEQHPHSIFVTAMDTHPMCADPEIAAEGRQEDISAGLAALTTLTDGPVFFCRKIGSQLSPGDVDGVSLEEFGGPHPAGLAGTHIHFLDPVGRGKQVWYLNYADLIMIGALVRTGRIHPERVVALGGPPVNDPRLLRARIGASIEELTAGELKAGENRLISGSILGGRAVHGNIHGYLGRYALQISVLREERERKFLGWLTPGEHTFSLFPIYLSKLFGHEEMEFTTTTNGSHRAMVPIGMYEDVMPLDIIPTFLLRSLAVKDLEKAEALGCLELDEEDLALCTMVCPGKNDYGVMLRQNLDTIEQEG